MKIRHWLPENRIWLLFGIWLSKEWLLWLTFANTSRKNETFPKPRRATGCWVTIKMVGNIRWAPIGNKCRSKAEIASFISPNPLLTLSPKSQKMKIRLNDQNISQNRIIILTGSIVLCDYNLRYETHEHNKLNTGPIQSWRTDEYSTISICIIRSVPQMVKVLHRK